MQFLWQKSPMMDLMDLIWIKDVSEDHVMVSEAGPSTCSTRPLLRIKRVPTCQYLQNLLLSGRGGRSIAARRAIDGVRFFAHLSEEPMSESRRCPPFTEMGGGAPRKWAPCSIPTNGDLCEKRVRQTKLIRKGFCPATVTPSAVRSLHWRDKSICKFRSTTWCCKVWVVELLWYFVRMSISCCGYHVPLNKEKTDENISWWWIPCLRYCVPSSFYRVWSFLLLDQKATSLADRTILRQITLIKLLGLVKVFSPFLLASPFDC